MVFVKEIEEQQKREGEREELAMFIYVSNHEQDISRWLDVCTDLAAQENALARQMLELHKASPYQFAWTMERRWIRTGTCCFAGSS